MSRIKLTGSDEELSLLKSVKLMYDGYDGRGPYARPFDLDDSKYRKLGEEFKNRMDQVNIRNKEREESLKRIELIKKQVEKLRGNS